MANVAPKGRKHLAAEALFRLVDTGFDPIPDYRPPEADMALTDALMSACAMVALKAPSLLAFDKERAEGNGPTIDGIERVPCDTHLRAILDPVSLESLRPLCTSVVTHLQRGQALEPMACLDDSYCRALDGTSYFTSKTIHWASCLPQAHHTGTITSAQQMGGAARIQPDVRAVMPLLPEPIVPPDGTSKHDGARHAAKRFVAKLRQDDPPSHASSLTTAGVPMHRLSRPCKPITSMIFLGSQKAIMPSCASRSRPQRTLDA